MQFQITEYTEAEIVAATRRIEHHGEDRVVALTMRCRLKGMNTLLDSLPGDLRHLFYMPVPGQPDIENDHTPLLRSKGALGAIPLTCKYEGWTMYVDHGVDESDPIVCGAVKVDKFVVTLLEGGSVEETFNVSTNDVDDEELGILMGKLTMPLRLIAPVTKEGPVIDGSVGAFEADHPSQGALIGDDGEPADATAEFVAQHGDGGSDDDGAPQG